jgi:hypothetical protein
MVPERALDSIVIRRAQPSDLAAVTAIYNDAVLTPAATHKAAPSASRAGAPVPPNLQ